MTSVLKKLEKHIADNLKRECDEKGKEKEPSLSAKKLHMLGLIYKEGTDMSTLIKSAALLNAAIARKPDNISEIKEDLRLLCSHVLHVADAKQKNADLIKTAKKTKLAFETLRRKVNESLQKVKKIPDERPLETIVKLEREKVYHIREIQNEITSAYKLSMANLSKYCIRVMGVAPCKFAHVGMGSMARSEITPFSDYENIIVLEDGCQNNDEIYKKKVLPFFRHYAVIFQIVLINLQETILPSVSIASLNDTTTEGGDWFFDAFTTRGVSFDGMMPHACKSPLGRYESTELKPWKTELIKPVSEMLKYLETEEDLKNGYHLADILTKTCFVNGDKAIYEVFSKGITKTLKSCDESTIREQIKSQVTQDIDSFSTRCSLSTSKSAEAFNFKRIIYRSSTIFISALGRLHNTQVNSCFEILEDLQKKKILSYFAKRKLEYCVALACEIRLRFYMASNGQNDWIESICKSGNKTSNLIQAIGKASCISYFQIAYSLQCEMCRMLSIKKTRLYSDLRFVNIAIYEFLGLSSESVYTLQECSNELSSDSKFYAFDPCLHNLERASKQVDESLISSKKGLKFHFKIRLSIGTCLYRVCEKLYETKNYNEVVEFGKKFLNSAIAKTDESTSIGSKAKILYYVGYSLYKMSNFQEALVYFKECLQLQTQLSTNDHFDDNVASTRNQLGLCCMLAGLYGNAITHFKCSMGIYKQISANEGCDRTIAYILNNIGVCLRKIEKYDEAMMFLKQSLNIFEQTSSNKNADRYLACVHCEIGNCLKASSQKYEAINSFEKSLEIYEGLSSDKGKDKNLAYALVSYSICLKDTGRYDDAMNSLEQALQIYQRTSPNQDTDRNIASAHLNIGVCLKETGQYDEALSSLEQSLKIHQTISSDKDADADVAFTLHQLALCSNEARLYDEAEHYFHESRKIKRRISIKKPEKNGFFAL